MSKRCEFCGKKSSVGCSVTRRGLAKKKGGVGKKTTGITKRRFRPNLQPRKAVINGRARKVLICAKCLKKGKLPLTLRQAAVSND